MGNGFHPALGRKNPHSTSEDHVGIFSHLSALLRLIIMRPDSELLILDFDLKKGWACCMRSDFAKSDEVKSDLRIRWPKSSDFGPKSDDLTHRVIKSKNGIGF